LESIFLKALSHAYWYTPTLIFVISIL